MKNRKLVYGLMLVISLTSSCKPHGLAKIYQDEHFDTVIDRNFALQEYANKASQSTGKERKKYLIKFFNAFPSDFETFFPDLCIVDSAREMPREMPSNRFKDFDLQVYLAGVFPKLGENIRNIGFKRPYTILYDVAAIVPEEIFYRKMLAVQIDWFDALSHVVQSTTAYSLQINAINPFLTKSELFPISSIEPADLGEKEYKKLIAKNQEMIPISIVLPDLKPIWIKLLEEKTDDEICAFWYGYHRRHGNAVPVTFEGNWEAIYRSLVKMNPRIANLMRKACDKILENTQNEEDKDMEIKRVTLTK
eukprot:gene4021-5027_t